LCVKKDGGNLPSSLSGNSKLQSIESGLFLIAPDSDISELRFTIHSVAPSSVNFRTMLSQIITQSSDVNIIGIADSEYNPQAHILSGL